MLATDLYAYRSVLGTNLYKLSRLVSLLPQSLYRIASLLTSDVIDSGILRIQGVDQIHAFSQEMATTSSLRAHMINMSDSLITMRNMDSLKY